MDLDIEGKIALVSGAAMGIGKETSRQLLEEGVTVIMTDKEAEALEETAAELEEYKNLFYSPADITNLKDLRNLHSYIKEEVGTIDILVQNAGITGKQALFHELTDEDWIKTIEGDLLGPVRITREFISDLRESRWGRIVFLSSENGVMPYKNELPYNSSKAGILAFSKGLSKTYAAEGILVNTVSPAFIETAMTDKMIKKKAEEKQVSFEEAEELFLEKKKPHIELNRRGDIKEVAAVVVFLCSDKASYVNGSNYRVDAGSVPTI